MPDATSRRILHTRGKSDRLQKGNWFEDPSNNSIACRQTAARVQIGDIETDEEGEPVFSKRQSLIWKSVKVTRIYDAKNKTLIYLAHATQVQNGSAKMSISTVPLWSADVTWEKGEPGR